MRPPQQLSHRFTHHIKNHLVPTKHNGFIPKLLHEKQVLAMLVLGLVALSFSQIGRLTNSFGLLADVYPATIVSLTNQDRTANNLPTLTTNATLQAAAKLKAQDMAAHGYFAHTSPQGYTPWYWFAKAGYGFIYAGENLAINYSDSGDVETAWLNSPTHRANILNSNFTEMGVATATGLYQGHQTTFVVELFGMPAVGRTTTPGAPTIVTPTPAATGAPQVAGESTSKLTVLKDTPTFSMVQNTDRTLEVGDPIPVPDPSIPWYRKVLLHSDDIASLILEILFVLVIITVAGMVAREYEKKHRVHMVYGSLLAIILFSSLFVGRLGFFTHMQPLAAAPTFDSTTY